MTPADDARSQAGDPRAGDPQAGDPQAGEASVQDGPDGAWTADAIRNEHETTLADFTPVQAKALARINRAFRESRFNNRSAKETMQELYAREAEERNAQRAGRPAIGAGITPTDPSALQPPPDAERNPPLLRQPNVDGPPPITPRPPGAPDLDAAPADGGQSAPEGFSDTDGSASGSGGGPAGPG